MTPRLKPPFSTACVKVFNLFSHRHKQLRVTFQKLHWKLTSTQARHLELRSRKSSNALSCCMSYQGVSGLSCFQGKPCLLQPITSHTTGFSAQQSYILNCSRQIPAIKAVPGQVDEVCGGEVSGVNSCLSLRRRAGRKIHKQHGLQIAQPVTKKTSTLISNSSNLPSNTFHSGPPLFKAVLSLDTPLYRQLAHAAHHGLHKGVLLPCCSLNALQISSKWEKSAVPRISLCIALSQASHQPSAGQPQALSTKGRLVSRSPRGESFSETCDSARKAREAGQIFRLGR